MDELIQDVKLSLRLLINAPLLTATTLLTLILGVGANVAVFTIVNAVLIQPLPYPQADQLLALERRASGQLLDTVSATLFSFIRDHQSSLGGVAAYDLVGSGANLTGGSAPERVQSLRVSANFFSVLGVNPQIGRGFSRGDDQPGGPGVVMLSAGIWKTRFNSDAAVVGRQIRIGDDSYTILGVLPDSFAFPIQADVWTPLRAVPDGHDQANLFKLVARLKPGADVARVQQDLSLLTMEFRQQYPTLLNPGDNIEAQDYHASVVGNVRKPLYILLGVVAMVLLIACSNIANLLLARASGRQTEFALRFALGARRSRLLRQLFTETIVLALIGGALAVTVVKLGLPGLLNLAPQALPALRGVQINFTVLVFALAVSLITGVLCALLPALQATRLELSSVINEGSLRISSGGVGRWFRNILTIAQIALSMVLLIGAGLLIRSYLALEMTKPGFDPANVLSFQISAVGPQFSQTAAITDLSQHIVERVQNLPGISSAAFVTSLPTEQGPGLPFDIVGRPQSDGDNTGATQWRVISARYFDVMRIPIVRGRVFSDHDSATAPAAIIINRTFERRFFAGRNAVGEHLVIGRIMGPEFADLPREIVGVIDDVRELGIERDPPPEMYIPLAQTPDRYMALASRVLPLTWVARTVYDPAQQIPMVRNAVRSVAGNQPPSGFRSMEQVLSAGIARRKFDTWLLALFAGIATILSTVGIYGVVSYSVSERRTEMGIRVALGSTVGALFAIVLRDALKLAAAGLGIGILSALVLARVMSSLLFGVTAANPTVFLDVSLLLLGVMLAASAIPAMRVFRTDPVALLRQL